ncbi:hypothetical protein HaLaN_13295, partial [Haematococcus lacustris]
MMKYDQAKTQQVFDNKCWTLAALFHHLKDTKLIRKSEHYALQVTERTQHNSCAASVCPDVLM